MFKNNSSLLRVSHNGQKRQKMDIEEIDEENLLEEDEEFLDAEFLDD